MSVSDEDITNIRRMRTVYDSEDPAQLIFNVRLPCVSTEGDIQKLYSTTLQGGIALSGNSELDKDIAMTRRQVHMTINDMIEMIRIEGHLSLVHAYHAVFITETIRRHFNNIREVLEIDRGHKIPVEDLQDLEKFHGRLQQMALPYLLKEVDRPISEPGALVNIIDLMYPKTRIKESLVEKAAKPTKMMKGLYDTAGSSDIDWSKY